MGRLLVVDDEVLLGRTLRQVLDDWELVYAQCVAEAKAALAGPAFDAVLCDWQLGGESGLEVWQHIRGEHPRLLERFAFMTGSPTYELGEAASRCPVLEKPFRARELRALLAKIAPSFASESGR